MSLQKLKYLVTNRQSWKLFSSGHKGLEGIEQLLLQIPFLQNIKHINKKLGKKRENSFKNY